MTHSRSELQGYYGRLILRHFTSHSGKDAQEDTGSGQDLSTDHFSERTTTWAIPVDSHGSRGEQVEEG